MVLKLWRKYFPPDNQSIGKKGIHQEIIKLSENIISNKMPELRSRWGGAT